MTTGTGLSIVPGFQTIFRGGGEVLPRPLAAGFLLGFIPLPFIFLFLGKTFVPLSTQVFRWQRSEQAWPPCRKHTLCHCERSEAISFVVRSEIASLRSQ
jgi:hypothetical protein